MCIVILSLQLLSETFLNLIRIEQDIIKMCIVILSLQILSETFLNLIRLEQDIIKNVHSYPCKYPLFSPDFKAILIFPKVSRKAIKHRI